MADTVEALIRQAAEKHGIPAELALAVAEQESGFNPTLVNPKSGAIGTFQFLPTTASKFGIDPHDPRQNIDGGAMYLRELMDRHQGDLNKVLAEYGGVKTDTTYVPGVLARIPKFKGVATAVAPAGAVAAPGATTAAPPPPAAGRGTGSQNIGATAFENASAVTRGLDPYLPEGRNNWAAGLGAAATLALTKNPALAARVATAGIPAMGIRALIARTLAGPLGAAVAGAGERAVEESIGTAEPGGVTQTGLQQGATEAVAQGVLWPITKRISRALAGPKVATVTEAKLRETAKHSAIAGQATIHGAQDEIKLAKRMLEDSAKIARQSHAESAAAHTTAANEFAAGNVRAARTTSAAAIKSARRSAAEKLAQAELDSAKAIAEVTTDYDNLLAHVPSQFEGGAAVSAAVTGPTKRALDIAGQRVDQAAVEAAQSGLSVPAAEFKSVLGRLAEQWRPSELYGGGIAPMASHGTPIPIPSALAIGARPSGMGAGPRITIDEYRQLISKTLKDRDVSAIPGVLGRVQELADETIPFDVAHKVKMLLDSSVNWDRPAKSVLERITKAARISLREMMPKNEGYDAATAAYQAVVPMYRKGVGKRLIQLANTPDGASQMATMLNKATASQARTLKQFLVDQAAAGGDALTGQRAWDAVRSAHTFDTLLSGGVDSLGERLIKLNTTRPDFVRTVYGDVSGQQVLSNLGAIAEAYAQATARATAETAATKAAGRTTIEVAREAGKSTVEQAKLRGAAGVREAKAVAAESGKQLDSAIGARLRRAEDAGITRLRTVEGEVARNADQLAATRRSFEESSLHGWQNRTLLNTAATAAQAGALGVKSYWGVKAILRLLQAPSSADLLQWAAYSTPNTVRLVKTLEGTATPVVISGILREMLGVVGVAPMASHSGAPTAAAPTATAEATP